MLKVFMLVIILLTTGFGVNYAYFANFKATTISQNEMAANAILNKLKSYAVKKGNNYIMPYGVNVDGYHQLPTYLSGSRVTRIGIPFVYCPFSQQGVLTEDAVVQINEEENYIVSIINDTTTKDRDYVLASEAAPSSDVVAIVISPEKSSAIPDCRDVTVNDQGRYVLGADSQGLGRVHVLTVHDIQTSDRVNVEYVDSANANALSAALQEVANSPAEDHIIILKSGETYSISSSYTFSPLYLGKKGSVIIRGESSASPSVISSSSNVLLSFEEMFVTVENITFSNNVQASVTNSELKMRAVNGGLLNIENSSAELQNVGLNGNTVGATGLQIIGSTVHIESNLNITSASNPAVYVRDSEIIHENGNLSLGTSNGSIALQMLNSKWASRLTNTNFSVNSGTAQAIVFIDSESRYVASNGNTSGTGDVSYGVFSLGVTQFSNFGLNLNENTVAGVYLGSGSRARFESSSVGTSGAKVVTGIIDAGALSATGNVNVYGVTCYAGDGFAREITDTISDSVVTQVNGDFSIVVGSVPKSVNLDITSNFNSLQTNCF